jgi:hypothetical protein
VTEGVVLGAAADVIERRVGETDHVEVVDHHPGGGQALGHGGGVGLVGIDHHMADPCQPWRRLDREPLGDRDSAASRQNIDESSCVEVDDPGHQQRRAFRGGGEERGLIQPERPRGTETGEVIDAGPAVVAHRGHRCVPGHPEVPGRLADRVLCGVDPPGDLGPGRSVSTARGAIWSDSSDHVRAGQTGSGQRQRRLDHTSTTGRSASARSRTTTRRRPWPTARTPQDEHQARSSVVSTASHHSPLASSSSWAHTMNPSSPSRSDTPLPSRSIRGLLSM